jgi:hypothetical protein
MFYYSCTAKLISFCSGTATHFDNAEVTLNIPLTDGCEGSELYFKPTNNITVVVPMKIGMVVQN